MTCDVVVLVRIKSLGDSEAHTSPLKPIETECGDNSKLNAGDWLTRFTVAIVDPVAVPDVAVIVTVPAVAGAVKSPAGLIEPADEDHVNAGSAIAPPN